MTFTLTPNYDMLIGIRSVTMIDDFLILLLIAPNKKKIISYWARWAPVKIWCRL